MGFLGPGCRIAQYQQERIDLDSMLPAGIRDGMKQCDRTSDTTEFEIEEYADRRGCIPHDVVQQAIWRDAR